MSNESAVRSVLQYIRDNLNEDLTLEKIAKELNYSRFYIARAFAENTGCTIYKYIQGRRLTEAAEKLVYTDIPIVEIACEASYSSQQAFTLAFHKLYGCTPQEYRIKGYFYPKQTEISMCSRFYSASCRNKAGRMAA